MQFTRLILEAQKAAAAKYVEYFTHPDKQLASLEDVFPRAPILSDHIIKFHKQLCDEMQKNKFQYIGIKVLSPSAQSIRLFKSTETLCTPLFSNMMSTNQLSIQRKRLQYVEPAVCLVMSDQINRGCTIQTAPSRCHSFAPVLEFTGTRYPFFCPSVGALACDLGMCAALVKGDNIQLNSRNTSNLINHHFVVTLNDQPLQVGASKYCLGSPFTAVCMASSYAIKLDRPLQRNHIVLCSALSHRKPVQRGKYTMNWGLLG